MCNRMAGFVLAFFLAASVMAAPTASELLQKGIYTQETVGDIDAAIRIYQQVVALGQMLAPRRLRRSTGSDCACCARDLPPRRRKHSTNSSPIIPNRRNWLRPPGSRIRAG